MPRIHTHYDNLKVARNAPPEVIRAAYKALSQRYHPDRNSDANAADIMAILNASYAALSDSDSRQAHDAWIIRQEAMADVGLSAEQLAATEKVETNSPEKPSKPFWLFKNLANFWIIYVLGALFFYAYILEKKAPSPGPKPYGSAPQAQVSEPNKIVDPYKTVDPSVAIEKQSEMGAVEKKKPNCELQELDPNGRAWPAAAQYLEGQEHLHADGLSTVMVDNSQNDSNVFVKLVSLDGPKAYPVRSIYIPAYSNFKAENVSAGSYDIRYRDLVTGCLSRSEQFLLTEVPVDGGTQYSAYTMTLYKVIDGNMETYPLADSEF